MTQDQTHIIVEDLKLWKQRKKCYPFLVYTAVQPRATSHTKRAAKLHALFHPCSSKTNLRSRHFCPCFYMKKLRLQQAKQRAGLLKELMGLQLDLLADKAATCLGVWFCCSHPSIQHRLGICLQEHQVARGRAVSFLCYESQSRCLHRKPPLPQPAKNDGEPWGVGLPHHSPQGEACSEPLNRPQFLHLFNGRTILVLSPGAESSR